MIEVRRMKAFMIITSVNAFCALLMNFMSLRKDRLKNNPHDTKQLYSETGNYVKFKRGLFLVCVVVINFLAPLASLITYFCLANYEGHFDSGYVSWFIICMTIQCLTPVCFINNFNFCGSTKSAMSFNRWKRAIWEGKEIQVYDLKHDFKYK